LWTHAAAEAQAAAIADDIAYNAHDLDDGLRAGLFLLDELAELPVFGDLPATLRTLYPDAEQSRLSNELTRRLIAGMISDVITETEKQILAINPWTAADIREAGRQVVGFSAPMAEADRAIKAFLMPRMYRQERVIRIMEDAQRVVRDLFERFMERPQDLPEDWAREIGSRDGFARARGIADFIAGMTDRFALAEHARLFDSTPDLR
jgi:dGTPase